MSSIGEEERRMLGRVSNVESSQAALVANLNALLIELDLPFTLDTPLDLTPSLLLAILESILRSRLPISPGIRESRTPAAKVDAMKIFLGVLEADIIGLDVGLGGVDPRKLASGEFEEVVFVAKLLCWLGRKDGILPATLSGDRDELDIPRLRSVNVPVPGRARSLSPISTVTNSPNTTFSFSTHSGRHASDTTAVTASTSPDASQSSTHIGTNSRAPRPRPMCIHEVDDSSFLAEIVGLEGHRRPGEDSHTGRSAPIYSEEPSMSYCDCPADIADVTVMEPQARVPVRYTGWINEVNDDLEVQSFESSRNGHRRHILQEAPLRHDLQQSSVPRKPIVTKHNSPTQHRLALLNERARLLAELAHLKIARD